MIKSRIFTIAVGILAVATTAWALQGQGLGQEKEQEKPPIETPDSAKFVIDRACILAEKEHKSVLLIYHASWCGWCKKLESVLAMKPIHDIIDKYYVVAHLTVLENGDMKKAENPGGFDFMKAQGGEKAGLPFMVMLNTKGKMITNSMMKVDGRDTNMGCPYESEEIENFLMMLRKASPKISEPEIHVVWEGFSMLKRGG